MFCEFNITQHFSIQTSQMVRYSFTNHLKEPNNFKVTTKSRDIETQSQHYPS